MANPQTFTSDFERGINAGLDQARALIATIINQKSGPDREDWQLGYSAACRELNDMLRLEKKT